MELRTFLSVFESIYKSVQLEVRFKIGPVHKRSFLRSLSLAIWLRNKEVLKYQLPNSTILYDDYVITKPVA